MKKIFIGVTLATTLAACHSYLPMSPTLKYQRTTQVTSFSQTNPHHPEFVRKLRNPSQYQVKPIVGQSICGQNDLQHVNRYDGTLGQPIEFVDTHKLAVGALAQGSPESTSKFCTGTLISEDLFLTAGHCIDSSVTKDNYVVLNYELAKDSEDVLQNDHFKVLEVIEDSINRLDYAILKVDGKPGAKYSVNKVRAVLPPSEHLLTIIQHPGGDPKQIESGPMAAEDGNYMSYADLDTEPGSSGSGVLDKDGFVVGVHTNGGCYTNGGANRGVKMTEIIKVSKVIQELNQDSRFRFFRTGGRPVLGLN